ncbi:divergent polysaccharide deacetylase family protein [Loktanella sp. R86503]|uniref:divergent polysaccharide deacetylase family protein n=1 Tax=Loktanella sp. R86503 TaxID=3093847 RepID=UPI0036DA236A
MAFLKGAFWGVIVGGAGVAGLSVMMPQPAGVTPPQAPLVALDDAPQLAPANTDLPQMAADDTPAAAAPVDAMTPPDAAPDAPAAQNDTPDAPLAAAAPDAPAVPDLPQTASGAELAGDAPVLPNPQSLPPQLPDAEADVTVDAAASTPVVVDAPDADAPLVVIEEPAAPESGTEPAAPVGDDAVPDRDAPDAETPVVTLADPQKSVQDADAPQTAESSTEPLQIDTPPAPQPAPESGSAPESETAATTDPAAPSDLPAVVAIIDTPSTGLPGGGGNVVVRRPGLDAAAPEPEAAQPAPEPEDAAQMPALIRYGAFFDNAAELPLMSVVLIDEGIMADGARALADVPFPITVLFDPAVAGASERMQAYADAGIEIGALVSLPEGGTGNDAAVALEGTFDALPRAVALVGTQDHPVPSQGDIAGRIMDALSQDGRGLLIPDGGLNSTLRAAEAADVRAATIYRDLDSNGQDARVIRRFIDQAAFRARQQPGVVLMGRIRPETISALILWGTANRAGQVSLAPLSATLLAQ